MSNPGKPVVALAIVVIAVAVAAVVAAGTGQGANEVGGIPLPWFAAGLAFAVQWVAFIPAYVKQTEHFYDLTGSLTYLAVIWSTVALAGATDIRSLVLASSITIWAVRLGSFLFRRIRADGKDGRFDHIKPSFPRFFVAWTLQGLWVFLTAVAAITAIASPPVDMGSVDALGIGLWMVGFGIEVVADHQKSRFRQENPGRFIDVGLWAWSRHPNYFGEIVLWVGIAVTAASTFVGWQWVALISPVFVYVLLSRISGVPLLEERADERWGDEPDYRAYKARTPVLFLRPPRRTS